MARVYDDWVEWRLANGSMCHVCPLNGQRKVGCDGPFDAQNIIIGEAPGKNEEEHEQHTTQYGKPFVGKAGWALRFSLLAPSDLCEAWVNKVGMPRVGDVKAFVMNVIMCRPPKNKITSKQGRRAVACCRNSAVNLLRKLLEEKPRVPIPMGGTALALITGKDKIEPARGRPVQATELELLTEVEVLKIALRGIKPPEEFAQHLKVIKWLLTWNKRQARKSWEDVIGKAWKEWLKKPRATRKAKPCSSLECS